MAARASSPRYASALRSPTRTARRGQKEPERDTERQRRSTQRSPQRPARRSPKRTSAPPAATATAPAVPLGLSAAVVSAIQHCAQWVAEQGPDIEARLRLEKDETLDGGLWAFLFEDPRRSTAARYYAQQVAYQHDIEWQKHQAALSSRQKGTEKDKAGLRGARTQPKRKKKKKKAKSRSSPLRTPLPTRAGVPAELAAALSELSPRDRAATAAVHTREDVFEAIYQATMAQLESAEQAAGRNICKWCDSAAGSSLATFTTHSGQKVSLCARCGQALRRQAQEWELLERTKAGEAAPDRGDQEQREREEGKASASWLQGFAAGLAADTVAGLEQEPQPQPQPEPEPEPQSQPRRPLASQLHWDSALGRMVPGESDQERRAQTELLEVSNFDDSRGYDWAQEPDKATKKQDDDRAGSLLVVCPPEASPGDLLSVTTAGGSVVDVAVPADCELVVRPDGNASLHFLLSAEAQLEAVMAKTAAAEAEYARLQAALASGSDGQSFSSGLPLELDGMDDEAADAVVAKEEEAQAQAWSTRLEAKISWQEQQRQQRLSEAGTATAERTEVDQRQQESPASVEDQEEESGSEQEAAAMDEDDEKEEEQEEEEEDDDDDDDDEDDDEAGGDSDGPDEDGDEFEVVIDVENADGSVEEQHIAVNKSETMGSVKRRLSVSMGLTAEQMAVLLGAKADGANSDQDDVTVSSAGLITAETRIRTPQQAGVVSCQFGAAGPKSAFEEWLIEVIRGKLTFKKPDSDSGPAAMGPIVRTAAVIGCDVSVPKKPRKGQPHAFRIDLAAGTLDSLGECKYIIGVDTAEEMEHWMNIFGAYTAMSPLEVAAVAAAAATSQDTSASAHSLAKSGPILCQFKGQGSEFVRCHAYLGGGTLRLFDGHGHAATDASTQPGPEQPPSTTAASVAPVRGGTGRLISTAKMPARGEQAKKSKPLRLSVLKKPIKSAKVKPSYFTKSGGRGKEKTETQLLEHLFQLDLGEADTAGVSRYVVACVSQSELMSWRASFEGAGCVMR